MRALLAPVALVAGLLAGVPDAVPAHAAAGETCQGKPATIVASTGATDGTDGDDVIVVPGTGENARHGYVYVGGGEGDDLICVSGVLPDGSADAAINGDGGRDTVVYTGSAGNERVRFWEVEVFDVDMGAGRDHVDVDGTVPHSGGSGRIDGGPGQDQLSSETREDTGRLVVDLGAGTMNLDGNHYDVTGFYRLRGIAQRISFDGDAGRNLLEGQACSMRLRGGDGDDKLKAHKRGTSGYEGCREYTMKLLGQKGDDRITGSVEDDVIIGGAGRDVVNGEAGTDRCVAEVESECER